MELPILPARPTSYWSYPQKLVRSIWLHPRVAAGALTGLTTLLVLPTALSASARNAIAWNAGGLVYLVLAASLMYRVKAETIKARAGRDDENGYTILCLVIIAVLANFAAIIGLAREAKTATQSIQLAFLGLAAATVIIAWIVMQVVFAIHYAHINYTNAADAPSSLPALKFPGDDTPDYWDFLYFATSIGATSQTSDVEILTKSMRRLVTVHAIISFFFNTMVLAVTINIAASLI